MKKQSLQNLYIDEEEEKVSYQDMIIQLIVNGQFSSFKELIKKVCTCSLIDLAVNVQNYFNLRYERGLTIEDIGQLNSELIFSNYYYGIKQEIESRQK